VDQWRNQDGRQAGQHRHIQERDRHNWILSALPPVQVDA
jgi:hypothetical protein